MMETQQADWLGRWGRVYGIEVETRLRKAFATPRGLKVLKWFAKEKLEPDPLAFLLPIMWAVQIVKQNWNQFLDPEVWKEDTEAYRQAAHRLREHGHLTYELGKVRVVSQLTHLPDLKKTIELLEQCAMSEGKQVTVHISNRYAIGVPLVVIRSRGGRNVARQLAIGFLIAYFRSHPQAGHANYAEHPPWGMITDFLVVAEVISPNTPPKRVNDIWNTAKDRARKRDKNNKSSPRLDEPHSNNFRPRYFLCFIP